TLGSDEHRALAREAVQKSLVLLKNDGVLPLDKDANIALAGIAADDIGLACGGWTIEWQGGTGAITEGTTLWAGLKAELGELVQYSAEGNFGAKADIGIVVLAEKPYAEGEGDREDLSISEEDIALVHKMRSNCDKLVLIVY